MTHNRDNRGRSRLSCTPSEQIGESRMNDYEKLLERTKRIFLLQSSANALNWDFETYMPPKGVSLRSEQLGYLAEMVHKMETDPALARLLKKIESDPSGLDDAQKRDVALTRREYDKLTKVPSSLVAEIAKQQTVAVQVWKKAKAARDWKMFRPELGKLIDLSRKRAEHIADAVGFSSIHDAMIDDFDRGMTANEVSTVFGELRDGLVPLAKEFADKSADIDVGFMNRPVPVEIQRKLASGICQFIGYDTSSPQAGGRVDETEHPFTTGYYDDVRITVHYHEDNVASAIYAVLHEGGHAIYEQGLNPGWIYQRLGQAASSGVHESMSRFIENIVGRSTEFWRYYYPQFIQVTGGLFKDVPPEEVLKAVNLVRPSKIRIEADEVTYSLHVIIRFEIERDLFADKITIDELPQVWNEKYKKYLGVIIENDSEGVMQDTHWASGYFGCFQSYALGNIYDGLWLRQLERDVPDWRTHIEAGRFGPVKDWLSRNIYVRASMYDAPELVKLVTGSRMTAKPFVDYIKTKYSMLFES